MGTVKCVNGDCVKTIRSVCRYYEWRERGVSVTTTECWFVIDGMTGKRHRDTESLGEMVFEKLRHCLVEQNRRYKKTTSQLAR